ncbi:hypothetical protein HN51_063315 [Arachis hypogaea]
MFAIENIYINKRRQSFQHFSGLQYNLECITNTRTKTKQAKLVITTSPSILAPEYCGSTSSIKTNSKFSSYILPKTNTR